MAQCSVTDGSLDLSGLLSGLHGYFREHAEAGPQLVLQVYLHRVVNSGGRIGRECAVARVC